MKKTEMVAKIKEDMKKIITTEETKRNNLINLVMTDLVKNESGTVESVYALKQLMTDENELRKLKDTHEQWPKSLDMVCSIIEGSCDQSLFDIDYELIDNYTVRIIINNELGICLAMGKSGCRDFDTSCIIKWGHVDFRKQKFADAFKVSKEFNVASADAMFRFSDEVKRIIKRYKMCP